MESSFVDIPIELQFEIIKFLDIKDLSNIALVSKNYYSFFKSVEIWKIQVNSLFRPQKFIQDLHSFVTHGNDLEKLQKIYKISRKATFIKNQEDLDKYEQKSYDIVYIFPGEYKLNENLNRLKPINIIGIGKNNSEVVLFGGEKGWGIINIESHNFDQFENSKLMNFTLRSRKEDENHHVICIGNVFVKITNCNFDSENSMATCVNIYGNTYCILENNKILNSNKHGIYCGQSAKALVRNNEIINTKHSGIHIISNGLCVIENNLIKNCLHHGIYINVKGGSEIRNNQFINIEGKGIEKEEESQQVINENNTFINCKGKLVEKTTSRDTDCLIM